MHDLDLQLTLEHHKDLLRAAEYDRLVAGAAASQPSAADRAALTASDLLMSAGAHLERWARQRSSRRSQARLHAMP